MTKRIVTILVLVLGSLFLVPKISAHTSMVSIGVRGGGQTYLASTTDPSSSVQGTFGTAGTLDLRYTFYGCLTDRFGIGFTLGAGVGYGSTGIKGNHTDTYTNFDYLGNQMDYTVSSAFKQTDRFAKGEATLMASFCFGNVILNIGPRFMIPFSASSSLTITEANIDAYYPAYNVHVVNEQITGKLETPYTTPYTIHSTPYTILLAAELGYEWYFNAKSCLGFQLYADVSVWDKKGDGLPVTGYGAPFIQISPITDAANPVPTVTVRDVNPLISGRRYLDFGVRVYYAFSVSDNSYRRIRPPRDTRRHHNRYLWY